MFLCLNLKFCAFADILCFSGVIFAQEEIPQQEKPKPSRGLSVAPGGLLIQYVKLGETYDLYQKSGIALIIENKDTSPHIYKLTALKPSEAGNKKWLKGYAQIPDPSWFWLENNEVLVEPQSKQEVKMFLKIPDEDKYYNQRWTVSLEVTGKPEAGSMLALAVYPRYQIETESKAGLKEKPDGLIGFEPSVLVFKDLALGKKQESKIIIYNNDSQSRRFNITPKIITVDPAREQIVASPGYSWLPNIKWLKADLKKMEIKPDESRELNITVNIPRRKEYYQRKYEALIFAESEEGLSGFARVQVQTEGRKDAEKN